MPVYTRRGLGAAVLSLALLAGCANLTSSPLGPGAGAPSTAAPVSPSAPTSDPWTPSPEPSATRPPRAASAPTRPPGPTIKPRPTPSPSKTTSPKPTPMPDPEPNQRTKPEPEPKSTPKSQPKSPTKSESKARSEPKSKAEPSRGKRVVYLTFDDGPSRFTQQVLDILNRYQAKATFFVLGANVVDNPSLVRAAARDGMSIQNHSWDHPDLSSRSNDEIRSQIRRTDNAIRNAGGGNSTCVRPPYGATNARVRAVLGDMDKRQLLWTIDTLDWERPGASAIYRRAVEEVGRGSIVLAHDGGGVRTQTVAALPRILENLKDRGYRFGTLCQ